MSDLNSVLLEGHVTLDLHGYIPGPLANDPQEKKTGSTIFFELMVSRDSPGIPGAVRVVSMPCMANDRLADTLFNVMESHIMEPVRVRIVGRIISAGVPTIECEHIEYKPTKSITL